LHRYNAHEFNLKVWRTFHEIKITRFSKKTSYAHDGYRNGLGTVTLNDELCSRQNLLEIVIFRSKNVTAWKTKENGFHTQSFKSRYFWLKYSTYAYTSRVSSVTLQSNT